MASLIKTMVIGSGYGRLGATMVGLMLIVQVALLGTAWGDIEATELTNGQATTVSLSEAGEYTLYYLDVPDGASDLTVQLTVGQGELALLTALAAEPDPTDPTSNLCYEEAGEANLECEHDSPDAGRWYVLVYGQTAGSGQLTAAYTLEGQLTSGQAVEVELDETTSQAVYFIDVPESSEDLTVGLTAEEGEWTIYTAALAEPDPTDETGYSCRQTTPESGETDLQCQEENPQSGRWYILVTGPADGEATLTATYTVENTGGGDGSELVNNAILPLTLTAGTAQYFYITVPEDSAVFKAKVHITNGSATVYTKQGAQPTTSNYDGTDSASRGNAMIHHHFPEGGVWHVMVVSDEDSQVWLQAHYNAECLSGDDCEDGGGGGNGNGNGGGNSNGNGNGRRNQ